MLQIVIWGMAIMLVVKAIDLLHQQMIAQSAGHKGSPLGVVGAIVAVLGALLLVVMASAQVESAPDFDSTPSLGY